MSKNALQNVDIALLYIEGLPAEYFDDFRQMAVDDDLKLLEEPRENGPYAAMEWVVPTAVAVYVGLKFIDAFLKRASDDVADAVYPKLKMALGGLVKKVLVRDRGRFSVVTSAPKKVTSPQSVIFSVYSETKTSRRVKFVFDKEMSEIEYEQCVEDLFVTLREHHTASGDEDRLSRAIAGLTSLRAGEVYLVYNAETLQWEVIDPIKEMLRRQLARDANAT